MGMKTEREHWRVTVSSGTPTTFESNVEEDARAYFEKACRSGKVATLSYHMIVSMELQRSKRLTEREKKA